MVVQAELTKLDLHPISVQLGRVEIEENTIPESTHQLLIDGLSSFGFELLLRRKQQLVEQIKAAIIELVHYTDETLKVNLSTYLSEKLKLGYASLSATFSDAEGFTIEKYFIQQKIEKVKELLTYNEKSLSEIAYLLGYSSVAHLSAQFKKITGETPSMFKQANDQKRKTIDEV